MGSIRSGGCELYYEEAGKGLPILLIPPAGQRPPPGAPPKRSSLGSDGWLRTTAAFAKRYIEA